MKPRFFFLFTLAVSVFIFILPAVLVLAIDPYFIYHKPYFMKAPYFVNSDRYQNAGLINSFLANPEEKFDKVIVGTSLSQNFRLDEHTMILTLAGGRARELAAMMNKALATGQVKSVVWEIFISYTSENPDDVHPQAPLPLFLYNQTIMDDWRYIFNTSVVHESVRVVKRGNNGRKDLNTLYRWAEAEPEAEMLHQFQTPAEMDKNRDIIRQVTLPFSLEPPSDIHDAPFPSVTKNLIQILKAHPDVKFDLFFPPVSYFDYAKSGNTGFWREMLMRRAVLEQTQNMSHVRVFQFDLINGIGDNLTIYRDSQHYPGWVNDRIISDIHAGAGRIGLKDWDRYTRTLAQRVNAFAQKFTAE